MRHPHARAAVCRLDYHARVPKYRHDPRQGLGTHRRPVPLVVGKGHKIGGLPSLAFTMEVDRLHGKWLVNYFMSESTIQYPTQQGAGFGGN